MMRLNLFSEKKLRSKLLEHAKEIAGETQDPIELCHEIHKVELELLEGQKIPPASKFGQRRAVVNALGPKGNVKFENIFDQAENNARYLACQKHLNEEAGKRFICKYGNRVLLTGQAGIGKSTLSRMVVQKIIDKVMLPNTKYIFYIKCKDIDFTEILNLFDFLLKYSLSEDIEIEPSNAKYIMRLIEQMHHTVILFDGMDEAQTQNFFQMTPPKCLPKDKVNASTIILSLMNGTLLPNAKVMITCRTRPAYRFSPDCRPSFVIQILGLSEKSQKELGKQICQNNFHSTYKVIHKDEDLETICYISVLCVILYAVLNEADREDAPEYTKLKLNSITRVMVYLLDKYFRSEHMRNVRIDELQKVAELARKGFVLSRLVFDDEMIREVGITQAALQAFMVSYLDDSSKLKYRIFEGEERCSFSHLIWQEFFTAIDLILFAPNDVFDECLNHVIGEDCNRWELVAKFMFGLTNDETMGFIIDNMLPKHLKGSWMERRKLLWTSSEFCINRPTQDSNRLVQVCNWIQEADDYNYTCNVTSRLVKKIVGKSKDFEIYGKMAC